MKKVLSVLLTLMLVATTLPMSIVFADEIVASESLTQQDGVYLINNAADLKKAAEMVNDGSSATASFKLMADIDYLNNEWTPMGISGFNGKFDGNGHVIKNVKMTENNNVNGFFGDIWETGEVSNLGLENLTMNISGGYWAGAFASRCYGKFTNCYVANSSLTNNGWALGGFVGAPANAGTFTNCYVYNVALNGFAAPAGFAGKLEGYCYFNNCYTADVTTTASEFYNFIYNTNGKSVTKSYCYSNMNSVNSTGSQTDATVETDKAKMATALGSGYAADEDVNNGYPCLKWQVWDGAAATAFAGGTGEAGDPYLISNAAQLKYANSLVNGDSSYATKYYKLTADINYANHDWIPFGRGNIFNGGFDGAGHVIKNVMIKDAGSTYAVNGFFGDTESSVVISNLGLENITIDIKSNVQPAYLGGFVGRASGKFTNCYIKNSSIRNTGNYAEWAAGAFAGDAYRGPSFTNCYVYDVEINAKASTPSAFIGRLDAASTFSGCYVADVTFENASYTGFGHLHTGTAAVSNCYTTVADVAGVTNTIAATYTTDKVAIANGVGSGYTTAASINGGYPCLNWEIWNGEASASLAEQDGVYLINNAADLKKVSEIANTADGATAQFKLMADINYLNYEWTPIGATVAFNGKFDGNGHVIKNVKMTQNYNLNGFFGDIWETGEVSNLGLENLTMNINGGYWAGAFASRCYGKFTNCYVANSSLTNNGWALGGFVGAPANAGTFTNCYVYNVALNGNGATYAFAGQLTGYSYYTNCYTADVTTNSASLGNFINKHNVADNDITIRNCYSTITSTNAAYGDATVADKEAIKTALVAFDASCAFKVNSKINNGYPCMSYQKAAAYDNEYEVTMLSTADGIKARIETNEAVDGATVYVATYDNDGRLIAAEALDADTIVTSTLSADGAKTIKVFVWDANCNKLATAFVKE